MILTTREAHLLRRIAEASTDEREARRLWIDRVEMLMDEARILARMGLIEVAGYECACIRYEITPSGLDALFGGEE